MANRDNPNGFTPWGRTLGGGDLELHPYQKDAAHATAIFPGDLLTRDDDGFISRTITPGTTSMIGVALDGGAASTLTDHMVADQRDMIFVAQSDDATLTAAELGLKCNTVLGTGSAALNRSRDEIDGSESAVTATYDVHLLRLARIANNAHGAYARFEVLINKHLLNKGVVGV